MRFEYKTRGTCSSKILFDVDDGIVHNLEYIGGCNGNLQGMSRLVEGMNIDDVIARVQGIHCGMKPTSCPCLLYTSPSPRDRTRSRMPSSA